MSQILIKEVCFIFIFNIIANSIDTIENSMAVKKIRLNEVVEGNTISSPLT